MEYYLAIKKNEIMLFASKMDVTGEHQVSQAQKVNGSMFSLICGS
jgi:hypothetical protein